MKALFSTMMYAGISGIILMGCTNEDLYNPEAAIKRYEDNWEKHFGTVDPQQTWNTATLSTANVTVGYAGNYTVKLYTGNPRYADETAYLLGQFEVKGGQTSSLKFDMPSRLEYVYVGLIDEEGNRMVKSAKLDNGAVTVAFGKPNTRTIDTTGDEVVKVNAGDYYYYGYEQTSIPLNTLPEEENNINKVTQNFVYESNGQFIVYPIYLVTSNNAITLGIYYEGKDKQIQTVKIWDRTEDYIEYNDEWNGWTSQGGLYTSNIVKEGDVETLRCKGIVIDIPQGTRFGFYVTSATGSKLYSEARLNNGVCYGATFHDNGELYLSFEDWENGYTADFNDLVCIVRGITETETPVIVDKDDEDTPITYIIACEDMGGEDDFDFNDIVLGIQHVSGQTKAYATLLAAGGSLPATVTYNNQVLFNEVHEAFGVSTTTLVNTGQGADIPAVTSDLFTVSEDFSMSTHAQYFNIVVTNREGNLSTSISVPDQAGATPQAFLIADPDWKWPEERVSILEAYPDFAEWIANHSADSWYNAVWGTVIPKTEGEGGGGTTTPTDGTTALSITAADAPWGYGEIAYCVSGNASLFTAGKTLTFYTTGSVDVYSDAKYNTRIGYNISYRNGETLKLPEDISDGKFYVVVWYGDLTSVTIK